MAKDKDSKKKNQGLNRAEIVKKPWLNALPYAILTHINDAKKSLMQSGFAPTARPGRRPGVQNAARRRTTDKDGNLVKPKPVAVCLAVLLAVPSEPFADASKL